MFYLFTCSQPYTPPIWTEPFIIVQTPSSKVTPQCPQIKWNSPGKDIFVHRPFAIMLFFACHQAPCSPPRGSVWMPPCRIDHRSVSFFCGWGGRSGVEETEGIRRISSDSPNQFFLKDLQKERLFNIFFKSLAAKNYHFLMQRFPPPDLIVRVFCRRETSLGRLVPSTEPPSAAPKAPQACWHCGETDHLGRNCPTRPEEHGGCCKAPHLPRFPPPEMSQASN